MRLTSIESSFHPCNIYRDCLRGVHREAKMCKKCTKMANFWTYGLNYWETVSYMGTSVWQASNPLFIHVTFTAIVPGVPREAKMCLRLIAETDARSVGDRLPSCRLTFSRDALSLPEQHRPQTICLHPALSCAASIFLQLYLKPAVHISISKYLFRCVWLSSSSVALRTYLAVLSSLLFSVWPSQLHFLLLSWSAAVWLLVSFPP